MTPADNVANPKAQRPKRRAPDPSKRHRPDSRSPLITLQQAAMQYGPPRSTIRDLVYNGHLDRVQLPGSRKIYIRRAQFEQLIGVSR